MPITYTGASDSSGLVRTGVKGRNRGVRNERKRTVLAVLEPGGWMTPAMIAALARMRQDNAYSLLKRYWRWGLLRRRTDREGRLLYCLSERGRQRLRWLRLNLGKGSR
jgi:hypothetical protein